MEKTPAYWPNLTFITFTKCQGKLHVIDLNLKGEWKHQGVFFDALWLCRITWAVHTKIDGALDTATHFLQRFSFALHFPHDVDVVLLLYANLI